MPFKTERDRGAEWGEMLLIKEGIRALIYIDWRDLACRCARARDERRMNDWTSENRPDPSRLLFHGETATNQGTHTRRIKLINVKFKSRLKILIQEILLSLNMRWAQAHWKIVWWLLVVAVRVISIHEWASATEQLMITKARWALFVTIDTFCISRECHRWGAVGFNFIHNTIKKFLPTIFIVKFVWQRRKCI